MRELLQQALDALINSRDTVWNVYQTDWRHGLPTRLSQMFAMEKECKDHDAAIAALEAELAQPVQPDLRKAAEMALERLTMWLEDFPDTAVIEDRWAVEALRQALAQPDNPLDKKADNARELGLDYEPDLYTNQQNVNTSEERVQKSDENVHERKYPDHETYCGRCGACTYKPWVGLTDEEIKDILDCGRGGLIDIKKVEAKLREKNG